MDVQRHCMVTRTRTRTRTRIPGTTGDGDEGRPAAGLEVATADLVVETA
ncbi:hypothetical protein ABT224_41230 [Streptomyces sp. NPDC001584]